MQTSLSLRLREWQEVWDCCAGNKLHAIRSTVGDYKQKTCLSRRDTVLLNRLRIGHTRLTSMTNLIFDTIEAHKIIDFIKETRFYKQL